VKIPKLIFQTSKDKLPDYVVELIKSKSQDWVYNHFTDKDIIEFFKSNYLDEFPNILDVFNNIKKGQHKSDLFRYYYLYINGGVYIDSDAMIYTNMNDIVKDYDFFSVYSTINPYSIFQGFIGCTPRNPIIYSALKDVYHINKEELNNNYHALCSNLFSILKTDITNNTKFYLYYEDERHKDYAHVIDKNDPTKIILIHYYKDKIIPK
jgi:mannosyltransferase OCH1-like enzyme